MMSKEVYSKRQFKNMAGSKFLNVINKNATDISDSEGGWPTFLSQLPPPLPRFPHRNVL